MISINCVEDVSNLLIGVGELVIIKPTSNIINCIYK